MGGCDGLRAEVARQRIARLRQLDREVTRATATVRRQVAATGTGLTEIVGVGGLIAARILAEVGDVRRFPTSHHFASANGTAPVPACSARTVRYRRNRSGNRRLNRALYYVAITQARMHPPARAYVERKLTQGKSRRDAVRCLQRRLSDVVYRALLSDVAQLGVLGLTTT